MPVNSIYTATPATATITYVENAIITFQDGDTIEMHFSPLSNFNGCNILQFYRDVLKNPTTNYPTSTSPFYQYTLSTSEANTQYNFGMTIILNCSFIKITSSQTPVALTFKFKRNTYQYL